MLLSNFLLHDTTNIFVHSAHVGGCSNSEGEGDKNSCKDGHFARENSSSGEESQTAARNFGEQNARHSQQTWGNVVSANIVRYADINSERTRA